MRIAILRGTCQADRTHVAGDNIGQYPQVGD